MQREIEEKHVRVSNKKSTKRRRKLNRLLRRAAAAVFLTGVITAAVFICRKLVEKNTSTRELQEDIGEYSTETLEILYDDPDLDALDFPFNQMSSDFGEDDLNGWWRYTIPEDYERTGGYLPDLVQVYTFCLCNKNNIRYPVVLALMEVESGYQYDALSSSNDIGYLQVNYVYQIDKMGDLKEKALYNPYVNIRIGIQYLSELTRQFQSEEAVLTAYHYGPSGAYSFENDNEITSPYAEKVLSTADRIEKELQQRKNKVQEGTENA